jgi:hypothetical protein
MGARDNVSPMSLSTMAAEERINDAIPSVVVLKGHGRRAWS